MRHPATHLLIALLVAGCAATPPAPEPPTPQLPAHAPAPAPQPLPDPTVPHSAVATEARQCLALSLYWEARGEGRDGMLAVGSVVLNRVDDPRFPDTVCGVIYEGGETPPCQFSWWCDGRSDRPTSIAPWQQALALADEMLTARPADRTGGALFFHSASMTSPWRRTQTAHIGNHVFYR